MAPDRSRSSEEGVVFSERIAVGAEGVLYADFDLGSLQVESHDQSEVAVEATAGVAEARRISFSLEREGDDVYFDGALSDWPRSVASARVRVSVPASWSVDVNTTAGSIRLLDIGGAAKAEASAGPVEIRGVRGPVSARTLGGRIRVENAGEGVRASTLGGPIRVRSIAGDAELKTGCGPIRATEVGGRIDARTGAGPIVVHFGERPAGELVTGAGAIEALLPEGAGAELEARASLGRVSIHRSLEFNGRRTSSDAVGRLEQGGQSLRLRTSVGAIRVGLLRAADLHTKPKDPPTAEPPPAESSPQA